MKRFRLLRPLLEASLAAAFATAVPAQGPSGPGTQPDTAPVAIRSTAVVAGRGTTAPRSSPAFDAVMNKVLGAPLNEGAQRIGAACDKLGTALATYRTEPPTEQTGRKLLSVALATVEECRAAFDGQLQHEPEVIGLIAQRLTAVATNETQFAAKQQEAASKLAEQKKLFGDAEAARNAELQSPKPNQERLLDLYDQFRSARRQVRSLESEQQDLRDDLGDSSAERAELAGGLVKAKVYFHDVRDQASDLAGLSRRLASAGRRMEVQRALDELKNLQEMMKSRQGAIAPIGETLAALRQDGVGKREIVEEVDPDFGAWLQQGRTNGGGR